MSVNTDTLTSKTVSKAEVERQVKIEEIIENNFEKYDEVFKVLALYD